MPEGFPFLAAAYIVVWVGLLIYLGFIALRMRGVRTELAAVEELVREQQSSETN
jgi:CcmD family protein